jgi:hypothetical protein
MSTVSHIHADKPLVLPEDVSQAIQEQQRRVGQLEALLRCLAVAARSSDRVPDFDAALDGIKELAESIWCALDPEAIAKRGQELQAETEAQP